MHTHPLSHARLVEEYFWRQLYTHASSAVACYRFVSVRLLAKLTVLAMSFSDMTKSEPESLDLGLDITPPLTKRSCYVLNAGEILNNIEDEGTSVVFASIHANCNSPIRSLCHKT